MKMLRIVTTLAAVAGMSMAAFAMPALAHTTQAQKTIAFLRPGPDPYYLAGLKGAQAAGKRLGYKVVDYFANTSQSQELTNVENAISAHVSGITGYAFNYAAETADIAKANQAKVPVFLMYGYSKKDIKNVAGFEQVNLEKYSHPVGVYVATHLKSGQVAIITGVLGRGDAEGYQAGFEQGLAMNKKDVVVTSKAGNWNRQLAFTQAQNIIQQYPNLKAMFVENEDMAYGAHNALLAAHKDKQVMLVSDNGAPYGLKAIKAGWLKASDTCSPALEGLVSVRILTGVIKKTIKPGHLYYSKTIFVTKANYTKAIGWSPTPKEFNKLMLLPLPKPVKNLP